MVVLWRFVVKGFVGVIVTLFGTDHIIIIVIVVV